MKIKKRSNYLAGQLAEHLVCAELYRKDYVSAPFAGNLPDIDLVVADKELRTIPIQVKAKRGIKGSFHGDSLDWMNIRFTEDGRQIIEGKKEILRPDLIYVYVQLGEEYGEDRFFILRKRDVQEIQYNKHLAWNLAHNQRRVRNPKSTHCALSTKDLESYEDNWKELEKE